MKMNLIRAMIMAVSINAALSGSAQSVQPDERGLWKVWTTGTNSVFVGSELLGACAEFKTRAPKDSLTVVVSGLEAWHYLKTGKTREAIKIFNSMLIVKEPATPLQKAGDKMARTWLTRLDREQVVLALKKIYARDIEFPATLEALKTLKNASLPPLTDRWGKPWVYRLESSIKGMESQRYVLESSTLGLRSPLENALKMPYSEGFQLVPVRMVSGTTDTVEFKTSEGRTALRQLGNESSRVNLVYLGANILILSDGNYWNVLSRPR